MHSAGIAIPKGYSVPEVRVEGGNVYVRVYNDTGGAVTNGVPYLVIPKWITGIGVIYALLAAATNATVSNRIGIVANQLAGQTGIANADYGWVQIEGVYGEIDSADSSRSYGAVTSGTVAANDQLEVIDSGAAFIDSGNNGGQVWLDESCALAIANVTTNRWIVFLPGNVHTVAAS